MNNIKPVVKIIIQDYYDDLSQAIDSLDSKKIETALKMLLKTYKADGQVFIIGNGGAAATASHLACDLGKGTLARVYDKKEKRLKVTSLTDNVSLLTALANDLSFEDIFVEQLRSRIGKKDLVIAVSASGNSVNVIKAVRYAKKCGTKTIGLLGLKAGSKISKMVDCPIAVPSRYYGPIESIHVTLGHILTTCFAKLKMENDGHSKSDNKFTPFRV